MNSIPIIDRRESDLERLLEIVEQLKKGILELQEEFQSKTELRRYRQRLYATMRAIKENPEYKGGKYAPLIDAFTVKAKGNTLIYTQPMPGRKQAAVVKTSTIGLPPELLDAQSFFPTAAIADNPVHPGRFYTSVEYPTQFLKQAFELHKNYLLEQIPGLQYPPVIKIEALGKDDDGDPIYHVNLKFNTEDA